MRGLWEADLVWWSIATLVLLSLLILGAAKILKYLDERAWKMEHKLDLNNVERTWTDQHGFAHIRCSCDRHFSGPSIEDVTRQWMLHVDEETQRDTRRV